MADFTTQPVRLGIEGLDLTRSADMASPTKAVALTNLYRREDGSLKVRPGQTGLTTAVGANVHSCARLDSPSTPDWTRVWGIDDKVYIGKSGVLTQIATGFSGDPLYMTPYRPPLAADAWMLVIDRNKMGMVRMDGTYRDLGVAAPLTAPTSVLAGIYSKTVSDWTIAGLWSVAAGTGGVPSVAAGNDTTTAFIRLTSAVGGATAGYYNIWSAALPAAWEFYAGGREITDEDFVQLYLKMDRPDRVLDVKLYFVCSTYTAGIIPGTSSTQNTDAYVATIRAIDYTTIVEQQQSSVSGASTVLSRLLIDEALPLTEETREAVQDTVRQRDPSRIRSTEASPGRDRWTQFGSIGIPFRRRDFLRIGSDPLLNWGDIKGVVVVVQTNTNAVVVTSISAPIVTGGAGPDSSEPGASPFDYRYTNYDLLTGEESNGSPAQGAVLALDSLRRPVSVTPTAFGQSYVRQRFYRRGGSLKTNWYFLGQNSGDGSVFTDERSDAEALTAGVVPIDNDRPVTTVTADGATVFNQLIPVVIGPLDDLLLGFGDPYRPGHLYWNKIGRPGAWPSSNNVEVSSPSEELLGGCIWNGLGFIFSRVRLYLAAASLSGDVASTVSVDTTPCARGLVNRWAIVPGPDGVYFVSTDGIYRTTGGTPESITDADLRKLFEGGSIQLPNGMYPVDFTVLQALRLEIHRNELWFLYQDANGVRQVLVYNLLFRHWRHYNFGRQLSLVRSEEGWAGLSTLGTRTTNNPSDDYYDTLYIHPLFGGVTTSQGGAIAAGEVPGLILGGRTTGTAYTHSGFSDDTLAISWDVRSPALDQSQPRADKLYGDLVIDLDRAAQTVTVTPYINDAGDGAATALGALTILTGTSRQRYTLDPFGTGPQLARNVAIRLQGSSSTAAAQIYLLGISHIVQPERAVARVTDWDFQGRLTDKWVKGLVIECDTFNLAKTVRVESEGGTLQTTLTVTANGRTVLQFSWAKFLTRLIRLRPTDANEWIVYRVRWIFDEEPVHLVTWETNEIDHGIPGWHYVLWSHLTLKSTAVVTLQLSAFDQAGVVTTQSPTVTSTAGAKQRRYITFQAQKGVLYSYLFTSANAFYIYREESVVAVQLWGGDVAQLARPFGNDDLDLVRAMHDAFLTAATPGGPN